MPAHRRRRYTAPWRTTPVIESNARRSAPVDRLTRRHRCTVHRRSHSCHIGTVASIDEAASCCRHRYLPACHASQSHAAQQQNATEHKRAHRRERRRRRRRGGRRQRICRIHRADKLACDLDDVHRLRRRAHRAVITGCRTPPASRNGYSLAASAQCRPGQPHPPAVTAAHGAHPTVDCAERLRPIRTRAH